MAAVACSSQVNYSHPLNDQRQTHRGRNARLQRGEDAGGDGRRIPELVDIRILVDDNSSDQTVDLAHRLGLYVFQHDRNYGYGRNQQTCYREALAAGADVVIMVHPDYQYTPLLITAMASMVAYDVYDVVLGSRIIGGQALRGGMPLYKYISNRLLTAFENLFLGVKLSEYHTGYRAFSRKVLTTLPLLENSRRFRLRQPDAGAVRALRLPHRRSFVPDEIFRGGFVHQFPPQREVRLRRAGHHLAVRSAKIWTGAFAALQRPRAESWRRAGIPITPPAPKPSAQFKNHVATAASAVRASSVSPSASGVPMHRLWGNASRVHSARTIGAAIPTSLPNF